LSPYVVAVAGPVGGGKSTLVRGLAERLPGAGAIHMDSYERFTRLPVDEVRVWLQAGADPNSLPIPGLAEDLAALKSGRAVSNPETGGVIRADRFIAFETQFGRAHAASGRYIDFLAWIDVPLEVARARKAAQLEAGVDVGDPGASAHFQSWLAAYDANYASMIEPALLVQRETVRPQADLVVDGLKHPVALVAEIESAVFGRLR